MSAKIKVGRIRVEVEVGGRLYTQESPPLSAEFKNEHALRRAVETATELATRAAIAATLDNPLPAEVKQ